MDQSNAIELKKILDSSKNILLLLGKEPDIDKVAASLALYLAFQNDKKEASLACPTSLTVEYGHLYGVDKIQTKIGNKNLVISLDYIDGSIEKVSYNVEGDKFNLVIIPKVGFPPFSSEKVHYFQTGVSADVIFVIGDSSLESLGEIYEKEKAALDKLPTVFIDNSKATAATPLGKINLINPSSPSVSLIVYDLLKVLDLPIDTDTASNVLNGIEYATNSFNTSNTTADIFEAAAGCLRLGGKRQTKESPIKMEENKPAEIPPTPSQKPPPDWLQPKIYKGGQLL